MSQTDIDALTLRASRALVPLLDKLYDKAFISYRVSMNALLFGCITNTYVCDFVHDPILMRHCFNYELGIKLNLPLKQLQ